MISLEIELKLRLMPSVTDQVPKHAVIADFSQAGPLQYQITNTYFDTAAFALKQHGFALRVRQVAGKILQTVKSVGTQLGDLHHRQEWEQEIPQPFPDLTLLPDAALREQLPTFINEEPLVPLFQTDFLRIHWDLLLPDGTEIELALDRGWVLAKNRQEPICELELELKKGDAAKLYEIADRLRNTIPLAVERRSKAEQGYQLYML